jgi:carbon-monoxide dehydrogenase medium subunit
MIPSAFSYHAPTSVADALALLQEHGDEAKILAGGHSLLPAMKLRLAAPSVLIDINKISELRTITIGERITIGALTTWSAIESHSGLAAVMPALAEATALIGDIQVRNRGTLGGSLAHADPAADAPAVVSALDATLHVVGPDGSREIAVDDFFTDMLTTSLDPSEIITAISFPNPGAGSSSAYAKFPHPASRYAIVGAAASVTFSGGVISACRVAVTGAGPKVERQTAVEQALIGGDGSNVAEAAAHAGDDMDMLGDIHASDDYRRAMCKVYVKRALQTAIARARG